MGTVASYCKVVKLSVGVFVAAVQLVVVKSEFCCSTKSIEGTVQESRRLPPEAVRLSAGVGVDCQV